MKKKLFVTVVFLMMAVPKIFGQQNVKEPNVSGQFYPSDPKALSGLIDQFLEAASLDQGPDQKIKLLISPHAGYIYSGSVAAHSYRAISGQQYSTVVLIGPCHFFDFEGISIWKEGSFKTPLGTIPIDQELAGVLIKSNDQFKFAPEFFEKEHSLEVEMPFLQKVLKDFKIVPVLMGHPDFRICQSLSESLTKLIGERDDVLVVISTDMSHYHPSDVAADMDQKTLGAIQSLDAETLWNQCLLRQMELCGFTSVITGLLFAQANHLDEIKILKYGHSGQSSGDNSRVVGYCSVIFSKRDNAKKNEAVQNSNDRSFTVEQKKRLLAIARKTITAYLENGETPEITATDPRLLKPEGAFVTLRNHGDLRGCIGRIISDQPLYLTIRDMARAAATEDTRFKSVTKEELKDIDVEISVLSVPERIKDVSEIQMGVHGVIVSKGNSARGVFLPQVADETHWSREEFLANLCVQKARLPADCWRDPNVVIESFTAEVFAEGDLKD